MREMAELADNQNDQSWNSLERLIEGYGKWIDSQKQKIRGFNELLSEVAYKNIEKCHESLSRMKKGLNILKENDFARRSFKLMNLAMLLQQISTKQLKKRTMRDSTNEFKTPWDIYSMGEEKKELLGYWRAFQIGFILQILEGLENEYSMEREIVDLIWFPTGGGKTEAYMGAMSYYMFRERFRKKESDLSLDTDGTNVIMRYTMRMLTTQQFQRASSLICAMEFLRRNPEVSGIGEIPGKRFSLGLWIGRDGSPNTNQEAIGKVKLYKKGRLKSNPLILAECPWCRTKIEKDGIEIINDGKEAILKCPDPKCSFGNKSSTSWIPVEVIDERIYENPPSLIIATVDKLAMLAYKPLSAKIFGRDPVKNKVLAKPPGLIIQDEIHLITGPLGTIYGFYEALIEKLCTIEIAGKQIKPKIIASTATTRNSRIQVLNLYAREKTCMFPSPGIEMGDSYFGKYAKSNQDKLCHGRLYIGINTTGYASMQTADVRVFSSILMEAGLLEKTCRDPWWTLMVFFNSIRELGGAKTLFQSDIKKRMEYLARRELLDKESSRKINEIPELTGRCTQSEVMEMMDMLSNQYEMNNAKCLDACLATSILEVGIDIDRLSIMAVVGQPKTTSQYIQVTGRVGRKWKERPGLVLMLYNPFRGRDRSHYEQFYAYHKKLYMKVEPASITPFASPAIQRAFPGVAIAWARINCNLKPDQYEAFENFVREITDFMKARNTIINKESKDEIDRERSNKAIEYISSEIMRKWKDRPIEWEKYPPDRDSHYLMLWPGLHYSSQQEQQGVYVLSNMRDVDAEAKLAFPDPGFCK